MQPGIATERRPGGRPSHDRERRRLRATGIVIPAVLPGRYRVRLEVLKDDEEIEVDIYDPVEDGPEVTIRVGVRTEVEMVR